MEGAALVASSIPSNSMRKRRKKKQREGIEQEEEDRGDPKVDDDPEEEEEEEEEQEELVSSDLLQWSIMSRLDAQSLARCRLVCRSWRGLASSDVLWRPLLAQLLGLRAQIPLQMLALHRPIAARAAYSLLMDDSRKYRLVSSDMCSRTWELRVKPVCGQYWYSLDPSTHGKPALARFFHCDGSITAADNDPIWGGQESAWRFVCVDAKQYIKINYWPEFTIFRLQDGRWRLENKWATYTTAPDLYLGTGMAICKEKAPPCTGCAYPRLMNAVTALVSTSFKLVY
ncbi:hypothetical protein SELMODRAFT_438803 [Selaginella moellendorffii]|uniref:F-box domain-containing protein n=1 Tax=Selaginella moellendorffii TaxID=88036 RepID=D8QZJ5_SELML|nr:uncharacterized protein LOC9655672 [Selaginella moellendorffii]EFJ34415.1 hypothetical protein SELMODRAFT_438803 [Selaginella moellendorffii]|eukprot:XP_002964082.1 uncharacterized protein LOC9655672 [Selaginella moellendorffii]